MKWCVRSAEVKVQLLHQREEGKTGGGASRSRHGKSRNATQTLTSASRHHTPKVMLIQEFCTLNTPCSLSLFSLPNLLLPPPIPTYRVVLTGSDVLGMLIWTPIAIDSFGCEMNWSRDVLPRAVVHFRTTNAAACWRRCGFRSARAVVAEQLSR